MSRTRQEQSCSVSESQIDPDDAWGPMMIVRERQGRRRVRRSAEGRECLKDAIGLRAREKKGDVAQTSGESRRLLMAKMSRPNSNMLIN